MQIIKDIEQGSQEWLQLRLGIATASNFKKIITSTGAESKSLKDYAFELASDSLLTEPEASFQSEAMIRGNELEEEARGYYSFVNDVKIDQVTFIRKDEIGYSPDGLIDDNGLIEIKCPLKKNHLKYLVDNKLPTEYKSQVQGGLYISEREYCNFISYHPFFKDNKKMLVVKVYRDEEYIKKLSELLIKTIDLKNEILTKLQQYDSKLF
jgi:putative phage-type endonuclease